MKRLKTMFLAMIAVMVIGAVGAGAASASTATIFKGTIWAGSSARCGFSIDINTPGDIGAGKTATAKASSFTGISWASYAACNTLTINSDFDIKWDASDNKKASIMPVVSITDWNFNCTYKTSAPIPMTSTTDEFSTWSGSGGATSSQIPCIFAPGTITIRDGEFS